MASNQFHNSTYSGVGTTDTSIYVAPSGKKSLLIQFDITNTLSIDTIQVDMFLYDSSKATKFYIFKNYSVPAGDNLCAIQLGKKIVLESGDYVGVKSSAAASADVIVSVLEDVN